MAVGREGAAGGSDGRRSSASEREEESSATGMVRGEGAGGGGGEWEALGGIEAGAGGRGGEGIVDGRAAAVVERAEERGLRMYGFVGRKGVRGGTTGGVGARGGAIKGGMGKFAGP